MLLPLSLLLFLLLLFVSLLLSSTLVLVWQRDEHLHIVEGEEPRLAIQHPFIPVLVDLIGQGDDVTFVEAQLALVLGVKVVQSLTAWLLWSWQNTGNKRNKTEADRKKSTFILQCCP